MADDGTQVGRGQSGARRSSASPTNESEAFLIRKERRGSFDLAVGTCTTRRQRSPRRMCGSVVVEFFYVGLMNPLTGLNTFGPVIHPLDSRRPNSSNETPRSLTGILFSNSSFKGIHGTKKSKQLTTVATRSRRWPMLTSRGCLRH